MDRNQTSTRRDALRPERRTASRRPPWSRFRLWTVGTAGLAVAACAQVSPDPGGEVMGFDLSTARLVDLTHTYDASTVYWPTATARFELDTLSWGPSAGGYFYSAFALSTPEHGGTHLDAPIHFSDGGQRADQVPLDRLIAPAVVIDIRDRAAADPDYLLTPEDVRAWETAHGQIPEGSVVLLYTGWSSRWPDAASYLGDDTPGDASNLHFPSFGEASARLLVEERAIAALGADVASIDYGQSTDFLVHRLAMARNVPGFENLMNLDRMPATGAWIIALPMKIGGGSGGPLRAVAAIPAESTS
jgi:kynurenine formamidase